MPEEWIYLPINPEPWAVGDISIGRKNGKTFGRLSPNANLVAFQEAVREELNGRREFGWEKFGLEFYFWRQQARYLDTGDRVRQRNRADATNMQKALEDALQGTILHNDRDVADIHSVIIEQGTSVLPGIAIRIYEVTDVNPNAMRIPASVILERQARAKIVERDNSWPPKKPS